MLTAGWHSAQDDAEQRHAQHQQTDDRITLVKKIGHGLSCITRGGR